MNITDFGFNYFLLGNDFIYQICDFPYDLEDIERLKNSKYSFSSTYNIYNTINGDNVVNLKTNFNAKEGSWYLNPEESASLIKKVVVKLYNGKTLNSFNSDEQI